MYTLSSFQISPEMNLTNFTLSLTESMTRSNDNQNFVIWHANLASWKKYSE